MYCTLLWVTKNYLGHKIIHHETYSRQHKVKIQNCYTADVQMQGIWEHS
jgi:hypothetical protein